MQVSKEVAGELGRLQQGRIAAKFTGEAMINTAIAAGEQIMRELDAAYQERINKIVAECGLPEGTTINVNFDTGEVTVLDGAQVAVPA